MIYNSPRNWYFIIPAYDLWFHLSSRKQLVACGASDFRICSCILFLWLKLLVGNSKLAHVSVPSVYFCEQPLKSPLSPPPPHTHKTIQNTLPLVCIIMFHFTAHSLPSPRPSIVTSLSLQIMPWTNRHKIALGSPMRNFTTIVSVFSSPETSNKNQNQALFQHASHENFAQKRDAKSDANV